MLCFIEDSLARSIEKVVWTMYLRGLIDWFEYYNKHAALVPTSSKVWSRVAAISRKCMLASAMRILPVIRCSSTGAWLRHLWRDVSAISRWFFTVALSVCLLFVSCEVRKHVRRHVAEGGMLLGRPTGLYVLRRLNVHFVCLFSMMMYGYLLTVILTEVVICVIYIRQAIGDI